MELGNGFDSISVDGARSEGLMQGRSGFSGDVWRASKVARADADADVVTDLESSSLPYFHHMEASQYKNSGYYSSGALDASSGVYLLSGVRGPFTPSQWLELEQQALIYQYIIANEPIPIHLLIPIRKAFESVGFYPFNGATLKSTSWGWGSFHQGYSTSADPEPGRCRRTDGKKWRCSRDAVVNQKYCEKHMNRGRHRSRKHVEGHNKSSNTNKMPYVNLNLTGSSSSITRHQIFSQQPELNAFIAPSDSYTQNSLPIYMDEWQKKNGGADQLSINSELRAQSGSTLMSSTSSPIREHELGLGFGQTNWKPVSWEATIGGPLAEAFQSGNSTDESKNNSALSLLPKDWDGIGSCKLSSSSPIEILQKGDLVSSSNSSSGSSPRVDNSG